MGLPCKRKKSQAGRGQAAGAARWIQRPGLPQRRQMLCSFFLLSKPDGKNCRAQVKPYAHLQLVIRLCCDIWNARTAPLILPARTGYKPFGCIVRKRANDIRQLRQSPAEQCQPLSWECSTKRDMSCRPGFNVQLNSRTRHSSQCSSFVASVVVPHRVNNGYSCPRHKHRGDFS